MVGGVVVLSILGFKKLRNYCNLWDIIFSLGFNHLVWVEHEQQRVFKELHTHKKDVSTFFRLRTLKMFHTNFNLHGTCLLNNI
jgi:hypothetical protein